MKNSIFAALGAAMLLFSSCGSEDNKNENKDSQEVAKDVNENKFDNTDLEKDSEWAVKTADAGMLDVQLSKLAATNAAAASVKDFAKMMADDHIKVNDELMAAAKQKNITLPAAMSDRCQKKYDELSAKKGNDFDKEYMTAMVNNHEDAVSSFKKESTDGKDGDLKKWAMEKLPALEAHLAKAKAIKDKIK